MQSQQLVNLNNLSNAKILTVDDEDLVRQSISAYLEDSGFTIIEAENGKVGLEKYQQEQPDLVLTDLQMPVMDGLEFLARLRELNSEIPVIVVSGAGNMEDVIEALRHGAWDYFTKPITDFTLMERAILRSLERKALIQQNQAYSEKLEKSLHELQQDVAAGHEIQIKLLPEKNLELNKYLFNHEFMPSLYLSGDFLDYFQINQDYLGFYILDVSGHGASSAFITIYLKSFITQYLRSADLEILLKPELLLAKISAEIHKLNLNKYLTMFYGVIDSKQHKLTYVLAGHYPWPILLDKTNNTAKYLKVNSFPVGVKEKVNYIAETIDFAKNTSIICYSDGILECISNKNTDIQEQELLDLTIKANGEIKPVFEQLDIYNQAELPDDVTALSFYLT